MRSGIVCAAIATFAAGLFCPRTATAAPITVAGFEFAAGEAAFADDAIVTDGVVTGTTATQVRSTLVGSNPGDSIRVIAPDVAVINIVFSDNVLVNGPGVDLVIFELSGAAQAVGFADTNERFEVSVFVGTTFSAFTEVVPANTGFLAPHDSSLSIYAVQLDLSDFGSGAGQTTQAIQIRLVDHLVSRSADPTAVGALNSSPVPEPASSALVGLGLLLLGARRYVRHSHPNALSG